MLNKLENWKKTFELSIKSCGTANRPFKGF